MPVSEITYTGEVLQLLQRKPVHSKSYGSPANDDSRAAHCRIGGVRILGEFFFLSHWSRFTWSISRADVDHAHHSPSSIGSGGGREERSSASGSRANSTISGWFQSNFRPSVHPESFSYGVVPTGDEQCSLISQFGYKI
jgi:hypothetical protein